MKYDLRKLLFFVSLFSLFPGTGLAIEKPADWNVSGYLDSSYNYLLRKNKFTSGTFDRVYDINPNGFTLQQGSLILGYQPQEGLGILINPVIGRDTYTFSPYGWNPDYGSQWFGFDIPQAYLQYSKEKFTLIAGELLALAGAENLNPTKDTQFSRSIIYGYATPTTVLGIRGTYGVNDKLTLIVGLDDGWDTIRDFDRQPTLELSVNYAPNTVFSMAGTVYTGGQRVADRTATGPISQRTLFDLVATVNATDKLSFIANYDYALQNEATLPSGALAKAIWQDIAGYVNYKFDDTWRTAVRGEIFSDRNGYRTGVEQCWKEITLTLGYSPIKNLEFRAETRHDFSNVASFIDSDGIGVNQNQQSYALEALYQFSL